MTEQYISLETARLAKERGFNLTQDTFYNAGSQWKLQSDSLLRTGADEFLEAPTQSLLQRWLREEHGIHISIRRAYFWDEEEYNDFIYLSGKDEHEDITLGNEWETYEDALENGLKEALKLIK